MKCKITINVLEVGKAATLYTYTFTDEKDQISEYEKFFYKFENVDNLQWDFDVIDQRIERILENGAEDAHFRQEGKAVKALPFETSLLRLYCYRIDVGILILGNGGIKKPNTDPQKNKLKDYPELLKYAETLRMIGSIIESKLRSGEFGKDGNELQDLDTIEIEIT